MERYLDRDRYSRVTPVSKNEIFNVSCGVETSTDREVMIRTYKVRGLTHAAKELEIFKRLAHSSFFVDFIDKINIPVEDDYSTPRSGDPAMILVSEALDLDLAAFKRRSLGGKLPKKYVRSLAFQLLQGLEDAHTAKIYVRDVHPLKIRVAEEGFGVKFSDFTASKLLHESDFDDCSKKCTPPKDLKLADVTYQAPELLVSSLNEIYSSKVDSWSVGCILVEMTTGVVPFDNNSSDGFDYLMSIFRLMGTPSRKPWANLKEAIWEKFPRFPSTWNTVSDNISGVLGKHGLDLIEELLTIDIERRISPCDALNHPFFIADYDEEPKEDISSESKCVL